MAHRWHVVGVLLLFSIAVVALRAKSLNMGFGEALVDIFGGLGDCIGGDD